MNEMEMFASDVHLWALLGLIRDHAPAAVEEAVWSELKRGVQVETITHQIAVRSGVELYALTRGDNDG